MLTCHAVQEVFHDLSHVTEMNLLQLDVLSHYNADQTAAEFGNLKKKKKVYLEMKKNKTKQHDFAQLKCIPLHCFLLSISVLSVNRHHCGSNMITDE